MVAFLLGRKVGMEAPLNRITKAGNINFFPLRLSALLKPFLQKIITSWPCIYCISVNSYHFCNRKTAFTFRLSLFHKLCLFSRNREVILFGSFLLLPSS